MQYILFQLSSLQLPSTLEYVHTSVHSGASCPISPIDPNLRHYYWTRLRRRIFRTFILTSLATDVPPTDFLLFPVPMRLNVPLLHCDDAERMAKKLEEVETSTRQTVYSPTAMSTQHLQPLKQINHTISPLNLIHSN